MGVGMPMLMPSLREDVGASALDRSGKGSTMADWRAHVKPDRDMLPHG